MPAEREITVAAHLQAAFAPRKSVFRPPPVPMRCVPFQKHARPFGPPAGHGAPAYGHGHGHMGNGPQHGMHHDPMHQTAPPPPPPPQQQHHQGPPSHTATPPPPPGAARSLQPTAQPFMPASLREATPPPPPLQMTPLPTGGIAYAPASFMQLGAHPEELPELPVAVLELSKKLVTSAAGWSVPDHIAERLGMAKPKASAAANGDDVRGGLFAGRSSKLRPERKLHHKVMSVLSRVTPQKYDDLKKELLALPIRQADDEELSEVVDVFFTKAVKEEKFSSLYADLVHSVFEVANEEMSQGPASPTTPIATASYAEKTSQLAKRLRFLLLTRCQNEFEKPYRLTPTDEVDENGARLPPEAIAEKKHRLKRDLCGNIRFVGELYRCGIVTPRVITHILNQLLGQASEAKELQLQHVKSPSSPTSPSCRAQDSVDDLLEVFVTLLTTVGARYEEKCPEDTRRFISAARSESKQEYLCTRIKVLLMNLVDLHGRRWVEVAPGSSPLAAGGKGSATTPAPRSAFGSVPSTPVTPAGSNKKANTRGSAVKQPATPVTQTTRTMPAKGAASMHSFSNIPSDSVASSGPASAQDSAATSPTKKKKKNAKAPPAPLEKPDSSARLDEEAAPSPSSTTVVTLAALAPAGATGGLDAAAKAKLADARSRGEGLLAKAPELRTLCEQLGTVEVGGTAARNDIVANFVRDALTTRRFTERRAQLPAALQLLAECPVVETVGVSASPTRRVASPMFTPAQLSDCVVALIKESIADGVFDDCPTFFANVLELDAAAEKAEPFFSQSPPGWRVLHGHAAARAAVAGILDAAAQECIDAESHTQALGKAVKALPPAASAATTKAIRGEVDARNGVPANSPPSPLSSSGSGTRTGSPASSDMKAQREMLIAALC